MAGENFGKFGKSGAIHQSFTHIVKLWLDSIMNEYQVNRGNMKLVATKSTWTLFNHYYSLPSSLSQGIYAPSLGAFQIKHFYIRVIPSVILTTLDTANAHTILEPHVMINK